MLTMDRLQPLILVLNVAAVTAIFLFGFRQPKATSSGWWSRLRGVFWRLPLIRYTRWARTREFRPPSNQGPIGPTSMQQLQGRLALGLGLASYFESQSTLDQTLLNQISWLRRELFLDSGLVLPSITVVQERSLHPFEYSLVFGSSELARGSVLPSHWLVSFDEKPGWTGDREVTPHPVTGASTLWVTAGELPQALASRCRCEDGLDVFAHHLRHALWDNAGSLVTQEFCQQLLTQGLERSSQVRMFRRVLETNQGRLVALMQLVLSMGGSLRDPGRLLFLAGSGLLRAEPIEVIARRVVESTPKGTFRDSAPPAGLSSALLYSYFWNEHLSGDLMSRSDPATLENLAMGMLEVQNMPATTLEQTWVDTLSNSEIFLLGRSAELAEQLHQMLQQDDNRLSKLGRSEQAAILILSLPRDLGQMLASALIRELPRNKVEELVQSMGRFGYLLLQAPPGQGMRQLTELGFRERIISEFLDYVNFETLHNPGGTDWLSSWLRESREFPLEDLAYSFERYYFPSLEPVTRLRRIVEQDPLRLRRALVAYASGEAAPLSAGRRAPLAIQSLHPEIGNGIIGWLRGKGYNLPCSQVAAPQDRSLCEWEFFTRVARPYAPRHLQES